MPYHYKTPLSIHFIWNPSDKELVEPIINIVSENLARDKNRPFSRSLNMPLFFYSSSNGNETPVDLPNQDSEIFVIFVFTSINTVGNEKWQNYIESLQPNDEMRIVPIALDDYGLHHGGSLRGLNCIRAYEWPSNNKVLVALVTLLHEVYRHGLNKTNTAVTGTSNSIKLFLSHSKSEEIGPSYALKVKSYIDETNMKRFFDATEIAPGFSFSDEIEKHISDSTLIAFETDSYSSRYWCQKEVLSAKKKNRPIIMVNCLNEYEDRVFPASSNVPCVSVSVSDQLNEVDLLRILSAAITETIRFQYSMTLLHTYRNVGWFDKSTEILARPPEIRKMFEFKDQGITEVCYPEPPVYPEEADWHSMVGVRAITPLWAPTEKDRLLDKEIGISVSDRIEDNFSKTHSHPNQLLRLAQDLARHLFARSATLVYGGDLRPNGFTEFILDEARILTERLRTTQFKVQNHLAWPLYVENQEIKAWRAKHQKLMNTVTHSLPEDVSSGIQSDVFLEPNTTSNSFIWSRSLTNMRESLIDCTKVRISVGGKASGYKGKMPGVLEEIMLAINKSQPLFLLGGFNGIVDDVCNAILTKSTPNTLTEEWQILNNSGYSELQEYARKRNHHCDYQEIISTLHGMTVSELAGRVGLNTDEYIQLMKSPFIDECTNLILKGLHTSHP